MSDAKRVNPMAYVLAAIMAVVLLGFLGLIVVGKVIEADEEATLAWQFVDEQGNAVFGRQFDDVARFSHGLAGVRIGTQCIQPGIGVATSIAGGDGDPQARIGSQ